MKFKLHDDSDFEFDDSDQEVEPSRKQSSSQKTPTVKAAGKSMDSTVLATLEEIRGNVGLLVRAQGLVQAKDPWIQAQEASDLTVLKNDLKRERKEHKETLSRLSDTESRLTNLNQELTAVRKDFEEYKTTNDAKLEKIMAQMALGAKAQRVEEIWQRAQALPEAEEEPKEESEESSSDSDLTLDDYNLSDFELEDEVKEPEVYDAATKAAAFGALLFQAQQALGLIDQPGRASELLNLDEEISHPAIDYSHIQNLSENVSKPNRPSGSATQALDTSGSSIKSKGLAGSPARFKDILGPSAKPETVSVGELIEEEYGSISESEDTIPCPAELPLFANLLTQRQEPSSPAPSTQKLSDSAPSTQDPLSQKIADLEAALQSKTSEISRMEQEHEETVRLMSEQLDNVYEQLRSEPEGLESPDAKDIQIETLEERNAELQCIIQANSEEADLQNRKIQNLEARLKVEGPVDHTKIDSKYFESERSLKILLNHFREQSDMLRGQVCDLIAERDELQKALGSEPKALSGPTAEPKAVSTLLTQAQEPPGPATEPQETSSSALQAQEPSNPAPLPQDPLTLKIADLEAALQSKTSQISKMEQEHEETVRLMSEQLDNVYERLRPDSESLDSQDLKDVRIEIMGERIAELQSIIKSKSDEAELQKQEIKELKARLWYRPTGSASTDPVVFRSDNVLADRQKSAAPDVETLKEQNAELQTIIKAGSEEAVLQSQKIRELEAKIEEMIENRYGAKFLELSRAYVDSKVEHVDSLKSVKPEEKFTISGTLLNHFRSQIDMLRGQVNSLIAQRDNLQKLLDKSKIHGSNSDFKDSQIDALKEQNAGLQSVVQGITEEADLQSQEIRQLETRLRRDSERFRAQVNTLTAQKDRLQKLLKMCEAPGPDPAIQLQPGSKSETENLRQQVDDLRKLLAASEGFMPNSNTQNLKLKCEDLKRDVYKLTQERDTLKSLLETEIDARGANLKEMSRLREELAVSQQNEIPGLRKRVQKKE